MRTFVDLREAFTGEMGIDLGGTNVGMAQHLLYAAQVCSSFQQMRGERVAQHMRRSGSGQAGPAGVSLDQLPAPLAG